MNTQMVIMVHIADQTWTLEALHRACKMAQQTSARITLVKMIPVQHLGWLGTALGDIHFSEQDESELAEYEATIESYGVEFSTSIFQYATLIDALEQAADHVHAQVVFASLPKRAFSFWHNFEVKNLRRSLQHQHCELVEFSTYPFNTTIARDHVASHA